ncbi:hypothetical protein OIU79_023561 [Salix purpurea]|uniref:Uncharacterized protein n=1 Tax=Salix purpurea TaxID=77065 RepID=A0A9Q0W8Y4_SALPP|nr:hypothetical protein OIU79_023561 [Salix purpurea]
MEDKQTHSRYNRSKEIPGGTGYVCPSQALSLSLSLVFFPFCFQDMSVCCMYTQNEQQSNVERSLLCLPNKIQ